MPDEPTPDDKNACHIGFRLPGTGERVNRRFLKTDTVEAMYQFIDSIQDQIQFENALNPSYIIL